MPGRGIVSRTLLVIFFLFTYVCCTAGHVTGPVLFLLYKVSLLGGSRFEARKRCCGLCSNCGLCTFYISTIHDCGLQTADCAVLRTRTAPYCAIVTTDCGAVSLPV